MKRFPLPRLCASFRQQIDAWTSHRSEPIVVDNPKTLIPLPAPTLLKVRDVDGDFRVRRVYCVGRNYADHAIEMGHDPSREPPFFFQKNPDRLVIGGATFPYPSKSKDVQHEIELVVALQSGGSDIPATKALDHI